MAGTSIFEQSATKQVVFVASIVTDKKETPSKGCLSLRLLIQRSSNVNSASNCTTYHRVVTDSEFCPAN